MSLEKFVEEKIKEAMSNGEFDNLKGKGKPLNLDAYFSTPEDVRMGYSLLKSNDFVPEEVERMREISELKEKVKNLPEGEKRQKLNKELQEKILAFNIIIERNKRKR